MRLTVVVPCYNEEKRLPVEAFRDFTMDGVQLDYLFVDDGSRDGTGRVLGDLHRQDPARFAVLALATNSGKAEAVRRGVVAAMERSPDLVAFWDADLATPLQELPRFADLFLHRPEIQMVFASRVPLLGWRVHRNRMRQFVGRVGSTLISHTVGIPMYDTQCGAKMYRVSDTLREIFSAPFAARLIFDAEIIARFIRRHGRAEALRVMHELPVLEWRDVKGSKVRTRDFVRALSDLWKIRRS